MLALRTATIRRASQKLHAPPHHVSSSFSSLATKRATMSKEIAALPETRAVQTITDFLRQRANAAQPATASSAIPADKMEGIMSTIFATFHMHINSRIASMCGEGFYTIGPCGEENLAAAALSLDSTRDTTALHYRHLAINMYRNWSQLDPTLGSTSLNQAILDRARGYTVSSLDPVSGGNHCALGGGPLDFLVTSTLASQCPPAVGRALGNSLASSLKLPKDSLPFHSRAVHFVSIGDGSSSNGHFLSSLNLANYAQHRSFKCPVVFGISDNQLSISLKNYGYLDALLKSTNLKTFRCDGNDINDVYTATKNAADYSRKNMRPSIVVYGGLRRRFGHAATDRQAAYLTSAEIAHAADSDNIERACDDAVRSGGVTYAQLIDKFEEIGKMVEDGFDVASAEPKITNKEMSIERTNMPLAPVPRLLRNAEVTDPLTGTVSGARKDVMRKNMTKVIDETLATVPNAVYIGEDVQHGGYYLVTDGLDKKYPRRVCDFPPDETTLVGAGMGYAQAGLLPIVEIPYAKYLDCGADMFFEACVGTWLSGGTRGDGMVVRLQGFDRGTFGGNFHTHNMLHMPPGIDVVCYSNGEDYVRGFRNAVKQAQAGRLVMLVDCTDLLNKRHLHLEDKDRGWERGYPEEGEMVSYDDVRVYGGGEGRGKVAVVTYGNGVVTSLLARKELAKSGACEEADVDVIDCMLLSSIPEGLPEELAHYDKVLFADICKEGQNPLGGMLGGLQKGKEMGGADLGEKDWRFVCAPRTYNPLGNVLTFLNVDDVVEGVKDVLKIS